MKLKLLALLSLLCVGCSKPAPAPAESSTPIAPIPGVTVGATALKIEETVATLKSIKFAVEQKAEEDMPRLIAKYEEATGKPLNDAWGNPIRSKRVGPKLQIISDGADRKPDTEDDLAVSASVVPPPPKTK